MRPSRFQGAMHEITVVPKRARGKMTITLPEDFVRREGINAGQPIGCRLLSKGRPAALGILKGRVPNEEFNRHELES